MQNCVHSNSDSLSQFCAQSTSSAKCSVITGSIDSRNSSEARLKTASMSRIARSIPTLGLRIACSKKSGNCCNRNPGLSVMPDEQRSNKYYIDHIILITRSFHTFTTIGTTRRLNDTMSGQRASSRRTIKVQVSCNHLPLVTIKLFKHHLCLSACVKIEGAC